MKTWRLLDTPPMSAADSMALLMNYTKEFDEDVADTFTHGISNRKKTGPMNIMENNHQSPDYLRTSLAAAMTLGFKNGLYAHDLGAFTHLFSFFPERDSALADHSMPPMERYRRVQLALYLIDTDRCNEAQFTSDSDRRITAYGLDEEKLQAVIDTGEPFRTSGCTGRDGNMACNRPYGNSRHGKNIRNFPIVPDASDIARIRQQMNPPARSET